MNGYAPLSLLHQLASACTSAVAMVATVSFVVEAQSRVAREAAADSAIAFMSGAVRSGGDIRSSLPKDPNGFRSILMGLSVERLGTCRIRFQRTFETFAYGALWHSLQRLDDSIPLHELNPASVKVSDRKDWWEVSVETTNLRGAIYRRSVLADTTANPNTRVPEIRSWDKQEMASTVSFYLGTEDIARRFVGALETALVNCGAVSSRF